MERPLAARRGRRPQGCAADVGSRKRTAFTTFTHVGAAPLAEGWRGPVAQVRRDDADDGPSRDPATAGRIARGPYDGGYAPAAAARPTGSPAVVSTRPVG